MDRGGRLMSRVQIADIGQSIPIGSHVVVGWDPGNAVVIKPPSETVASKAGNSPGVQLPSA